MISEEAAEGPSIIIFRIPTNNVKNLKELLVPETYEDEFNFVFNISIDNRKYTKLFTECDIKSYDYGTESLEQLFLFLTQLTRNDKYFPVKDIYKYNISEFKDKYYFYFNVIIKETEKIFFSIRVVDYLNPMMTFLLNMK